MSVNRRTQERIPLESRLHEFKELPHGKDVGRGIGKDLSRGGMCILCTEPLAIHQKVLVNFTVPNGQHPVRCEGTIRWVRKDSLAYLIGVQFHHLDASDKSVIEKFIRRAKGQTSFFVKVLSKFKKA